MNPFKTCLSILLLSAASFATTVVTATVTDPNGNPYANGTASAVSVPTSGQAVVSTTPVAINAAGFFTLTLAPNTYIFTICAPPVALGPTANPTPTQVCFPSAPIVISGTSQDISAQLNAVAKTLGPTVGSAVVTPGTPGPITAGPSVPGGISAILFNGPDAFGLCNSQGYDQLTDVVDNATGGKGTTSALAWNANDCLVNQRVFTTAFQSVPYQDGNLWVWNSQLGMPAVAPNITVNSQTGALSVSGIPLPGGPCHYSALPGAGDQLTAAGTFATTVSVPNTCLGAKTVLTIKAHGIYTTTATSTPTFIMQINAGGTAGICPAANGNNLNINTTNGTFDAVCYIQINTTGSPGTAIAWGQYTATTAAGSEVNGAKHFNNASTVSYTTSSSQTVSVQLVNVFVSGQTFNLQSIDVTVEP
jgi:hypothetical protein